jgi:hypothetical protein
MLTDRDIVLGAGHTRRDQSRSSSPGRGFPAADPAPAEDGTLHALSATAPISTTPRSSTTPSGRGSARATTRGLPSTARCPRTRQPPAGPTRRLRLTPRLRRAGSPAEFGSSDATQDAAVAFRYDATVSWLDCRGRRPCPGHIRHPSATRLWASGAPRCGQAPGRHRRSGAVAPHNDRPARTSSLAATTNQAPPAAPGRA